MGRWCREVATIFDPAVKKILHFMSPEHALSRVQVRYKHEVDVAASGSVSEKEQIGEDGLARTEVSGEGEEKAGLNH